MSQSKRQANWLPADEPKRPSRKEIEKGLRTRRKQVRECVPGLRSMEFDSFNRSAALRSVFTESLDESGPHSQWLALKALAALPMLESSLNSLQRSAESRSAAPATSTSGQSRQRKKTAMTRRVVRKSKELLRRAVTVLGRAKNFGR